ncbi:MAG: hypothetical protein RBR86_08385 [Pseudobdellovibrionaceae bacterium]|jgi:hypothetical protein|nr:hypothetical protein [Pseudobdellovibrionaceae bacterium]
MKRFVLRLSTMVAILMAVLSGVSLFWVSQQVQMLERKQRVIKQQVVSEQEGIRVLEAEWDYLNRPDRLERLAKRYLHSMERIEPEDILKNANVVPERQVNEELGIVPAAYPVSKPKNLAQKRVLRDTPEVKISEAKSSGSTNDFQSVLSQIGGVDE